MDALLAAGSLSGVSLGKGLLLSAKLRHNDYVEVFAAAASVGETVRVWAVGGGVGLSFTHIHAHTHTHMRTFTHALPSHVHPYFHPDLSRIRPC